MSIVRSEALWQAFADAFHIKLTSGWAPKVVTTWTLIMRPIMLGLAIPSEADMLPYPTLGEARWPLLVLRGCGGDGDSVGIDLESMSLASLERVVQALRIFSEPDEDRRQALVGFIRNLPWLDTYVVREVHRLLCSGMVFDKGEVLLDVPLPSALRESAAMKDKRLFEAIGSGGDGAVYDIVRLSNVASDAVPLGHLGHYSLLLRWSNSESGVAIHNAIAAALKLENAVPALEHMLAGVHCFSVKIYLQSPPFASFSNHLGLGKWFAMYLFDMAVLRGSDKDAGWGIARLSDPFFFSAFVAWLQVSAWVGAPSLRSKALGLAALLLELKLEHSMWLTVGSAYLVATDNLPSGKELCVWGRSRKLSVAELEEETGAFMVYSTHPLEGSWEISSLTMEQVAGILRGPMLVTCRTAAAVLPTLGYSNNVREGLRGICHKVLDAMRQGDPADLEAAAARVLAVGEERGFQSKHLSVQGISRWLSQDANLGHLMNDLGPVFESHKIGVTLQSMRDAKELGRAFNGFTNTLIFQLDEYITAGTSPECTVPFAAKFKYHRPALGGERPGHVGGMVYFTYVIQPVMLPMIQHKQSVREFLVMRGLPDLQSEYNFAVACLYQHLRSGGVQRCFLHVQRVVQSRVKQVRTEAVVVAFAYLPSVDVGDQAFTRQRRINLRCAPLSICIGGRNYDLWQSREHMTNCAPDLHLYRFGYHDSKFLVFRHSEYCSRGEAIQRLGAYMDMRMVHSVVINENEASSGVMVVVHVQSQVPKPDIDEFVLKTGFMCLRSPAFHAALTGLIHMPGWTGRSIII
jgi:hypothetical protein